MSLFRNPEGVRVGQTWRAKNPIGTDMDVLEIDAVFGKAYIYVKTKNGKEFCCGETGLKECYSLENNYSLLEAQNDR